MRKIKAISRTRVRCLRTGSSLVGHWRAVLGLLILCAAWPAAGLADPGPPVRLAYLQNDIHHLACWIALEKGLFRAEGVEVQVAGVFRAGPEEMSAFAAGALDVGYVGEAPATTAVANRTARVTVVAQVNTEGSAIVVPKDASFKRLNDLTGRVVAIPGHATVQDFLLQKALREAGLEGRQVGYVVLKPPEMIGALRTGQVDAFIAWEPYPAMALTLGVARILLSSRDIWKGHPCCAVVVDDRFLSQRPTQVLAVVRAHVQATRFIGSHPDQAVQIAMKYTGLGRETVVAAMDLVDYTFPPSVEGEVAYVEFLNRLKYIRVSDPRAFVERFINLEIIGEAQKP